MERVAFLIEETGQRIGCLLNPETLTMTRLAGVRSRRSLGGPATGANLRDDPLLYTGGGITEMTLDLLFDVSLAGSSIPTDDVRGLTGPFWSLAENVADSGGYARPPQVIFVWGKAWSIPAVVIAVAESFEQFTDGGFPRRSWLRMKLRRTDPVESAAPRRPPLLPDAALDFAPDLTDAAGPGVEDALVHEVIGDGGLGERLDELAFQHFGDASLWRVLAAFNRIEDPLRIAAGSLIRIPTPTQHRDTP